MSIIDTILNNLENDIQSLRSQMMVTVKEKGTNHPDSIKCSQQLDILLNKYQCLKQYKKSIMKLDA